MTDEIKCVNTSCEYYQEDGASDCSKWAFPESLCGEFKGNYEDNGEFDDIEGC